MSHPTLNIQSAPLSLSEAKRQADSNDGIILGTVSASLDDLLNCGSTCDCNSFVGNLLTEAPATDINFRVVGHNPAGTHLYLEVSCLLDEEV